MQTYRVAAHSTSAAIYSIYDLSVLRHDEINSYHLIVAAIVNGAENTFVFGKSPFAITCS